MRQSFQDVIRIRGARVHNLKNIDVDIPRGKLVVITGVSGSGKSSLAFDTLFADGQRRYVESLSAYARQFLGVMEKPDVDSIEGISPAIAIDQRSVSKNPRSTVGTITEIYDYLRLLFARVGKPHCPRCGKPVARQSAQQIVKQLLALSKGTDVMILAPVIRERKGEYRKILEEIGTAGFRRVRLDGELLPIDEALVKKLDRYKLHSIEVMIDRLEIDRSADGRLRLIASVEQALKMGNGLMVATINADQRGKERGMTQKVPRGSVEESSAGFRDVLFSEMFACEACGVNLSEIEPRTFSFNSPHGACPTCTGIGYTLEVDPALVVPNPTLTLAEGAIRPWASASHRVGRQSWYWLMLTELADSLRFSLNTVWAELPKLAQDAVLFGDEAHEFEGVIPNLLRRWKESDSEWTRGEIEKFMIIRTCGACNGKRLRPEALAVKLLNISIDAVTAMDIGEAIRFFSALGKKMKGNDAVIARPIAREIVNRLQFLVNVGLDYLTLERSSTTLAGGEAQRIRLATQIGSRLVGVLYILDEPSVGLHPRDQQRLIATLRDLQALGNTVVVVEHDEQTMSQADWIIDVGPAAGKHGGRIVFEGTPEELKKAKTLTGEYFSGKRKIGRSADLQIGKSSPKANLLVNQSANLLVIRGAKEHNLKDIDVRIPLGQFVCVTGVSGSGKSTLINDVLGRALMRHFWNSREEPGAHKRIEGIEHIDKAIIIDQSPIGRTPRSNPATYTGSFTPIRNLFSETREARVRGYGPGRFSFNVKGGRCETCQGDGQRKIEMQFLPDMWVECEECHGKRYNTDTLEVEWHGKSIAQVLTMTVEDAVKFFSDISDIRTKLSALNDVGLGYIELGQPATMLSGGEAQRIKLAAELARRATGRTLYLLDEPTTGLHAADVEKLLKLLRGLVEKGNSVLVIEHNVDVIAHADWVIDLGPEGGTKGGTVVAKGTPRDIARNKKSYTGRYLRKN